MINWLIIALILVFGLVYVKIEHHSRRGLLILLFIVGLVLYLSVVAMFNSSDVDLSSPKGVVKAFYSWAGWFGNAASNVFDLGQDAVIGVGNVIKFNKTKEIFDGRR